MFDKKQDFEIVRHGVESILKINFLERKEFPSIEDDGLVMRDVIKKLIQVPTATKIIFIHNKNYEYEFEQVILLKEIAEVYNLLVKQKELFSSSQLVNKDEECMKLFFNRYTFMQNTIVKDLASDPIGAYVRFKRQLRDYNFDKNYHQNKSENMKMLYNILLQN